MRRGRMLSLCLVLALCLSLLPATALAAAPDYQVIYVGGVKISSTGYWTTDSDGNVTAYTSGDTPTDNYIHYDVANNTLTLHNATIKEKVPLNTSTYVAGAAIGVHNQNGAAELTITLEGTNTIAEVGKGIYVLASSTGEATLTITSESGGSLDASGSSNPGIWVQSNNGDAALFIQNAKVEATGTSYGVNVQSHKSSTASLTVDGGSLTASGSPGILYDSSGSGTVPNTTTLTISNSAIVDARNGEIGAGSTTNLQPVSPSGEGIVFNGDEGTVYGNVTLEENLEIGEGESLTIGDGASLNTGSHEVIVNGGTLTGGDKIEGTVKYAPAITTESLPEGTVGTAYNQLLGATGSETITWSLASGTLPTGLKLSDDGKITGTPTAAGTSTFTVTATNASGSASKEYTLIIKAVSVTGVSLNTDSLTLVEGGTATLAATITPSNATNQNVTWSSDNESVATVDNGLVTAVGSGTATITVKTEDGNYTADCTVYVAPYIPPVPSYLIQLPEVEGGTVTADLAAARQGTEVTLTVTPDEGFALASLAVTDFFGSTVDITRNSDGAYSFTMPYSQVEVSAAFTPLALPFADVDEGDWFYDEVAYVWANGLMDGVADDRFHPEGTASRAMVWAILARMDGETVTGEGWAEAARAWAMETGVSDGEDGGAPVTREQLAAMLYRYAARKGWDVTERADLSAFADGDDVSDWALDALAWASAAGIVEGTAPATLEPQGEAVRAQLAAMLARFCQTTAAP